jgi:hypothetical protein
MRTVTPVTTVVTVHREKPLDFRWCKSSPVTGSPTSAPDGEYKERMVPLTPW